VDGSPRKPVDGAAVLTRFKVFFQRRKKLLLIVLLIVVAALGPYVVSRLRSPGRRVVLREVAGTQQESSRGPVKVLRIATYNIAHGRGPTDGNWAQGGGPKRKRIRKIARMLAEAEADVVILNEVDFDATWSGHQNQAAAIAETAGFPYRAEQRNLDFRFIYGSWKFGNALLSKYPIVEARVVDYPPVAGWESWLAGKKRGLLCTLQLSKRRRVRILAVHLETRSAAVRVASAKRILKVAQQTGPPLIAAGDFNSTPMEFPRSTQTAEGDNAIELLTASRLFQRFDIGTPDGNDFTFTSMQPHCVIDWILIPDDWTFLEYRVLQSDLSDHRPVVATVKLPD